MVSVSTMCRVLCAEDEVCERAAKRPDRLGSINVKATRTQSREVRGEVFNAAHPCRASTLSGEFLTRFTIDGHDARVFDGQPVDR